MLTRDELIKELSATIGKTKVLKLTAILKKQDFALHDLIDLTFYSHKTIAYRAAWLLENLFLKDPLSYLTGLDYLLSRIKDVQNPSCRRHYVKIMMHITDAKAPEPITEKLKNIDIEPIAVQLFDWLIDPKELVAIKVFSATILFNLRQRYLWINDELGEQIKFLMRDGTPAIRARGKMLLSKL